LLDISVDIVWFTACYRYDIKKNPSLQKLGL